MKRIIIVGLPGLAAAGMTIGALAQSSEAEGRKNNRRPRTMEEVVVTAQKREERLQDVPISISLLSGSDLDKSPVQGITEALRRTPGIGINETYQGGGTQVAVRGVTAGGALLNGSSPVSFYLDSVPFGLVRQAIAPDPNVYDLERVEVLRGPQGTLYGASAQNGVVRVLTKDADLEEFEFKGRTSASSTKDGGESYRGDMALNVPLVAGKLAARAVMGYQDLGGWIDRPNRKDANDAEIRNMRFKVNSQLTDDFSIGASAWLSRADYGGPSIADDNGQHRATLNEPIATDFDVYGLKIRYDFPAVSVTSATSYLEYLNDGFLDTSVLEGPNTVSQTRLDSEVFSQEILLNSSPGKHWRWSLGGMYRDAEDIQFQNSRTRVAPLNQVFASESFAIFGEITRLFLDGKFALTGGLRYFEDEVTGTENSRFSGAAPLGEYSRDKFDAVSPRVVLTWYPSDAATFYASYAEGFRSGLSQSGAVIAAAPLFPPLEADTLHNYELGTKGTFGAGRVSYEAAVYYIDWQDVQQSLTVPTFVTATSITTALINGESASGIGFDFAVAAAPVTGLELGLSFSWNDLTMDSPVRSFNPGNPPIPVVLFDAGERLNISPEYMIGASFDYLFPLGSGGLEAGISLSGNYTSEMDLRTIVSGVRRVAEGDEIMTGRASLSVGTPDRWTATLFVDNVSNEQGSPVRFPFAVAITDWNAHIRPRTIGLQLDYNF